MHLTSDTQMRSIGLGKRGNLSKVTQLLDSKAFTHAVNMYILSVSVPDIEQDSNLGLLDAKTPCHTQQRSREQRGSPGSVQAQPTLRGAGPLCMCRGCTG